MGVANGTGGNVFDNVIIREITDEEIAVFDNIHNGVDWGWYPDPYAFVRVNYVPSQQTLYIFQEYTCNKQTNAQTAEKLAALGITANDLITCDSAETKSVEDYRAYGLCARAAVKGPGSREYSYKWLSGLRAIVIDNKRCPSAAKEFLDYEYERDKEGNWEFESAERAIYVDDTVIRPVKTASVLQDFEVPKLKYKKRLTL